MDVNAVHHGPTVAAAAPLEDWLIRDLVEAYPETMRVLSPLGIDLCCGGGHSLREALELHSLDRVSVVSQLTAVISGLRPERT